MNKVAILLNTFYSERYMKWLSYTVGSNAGNFRITFSLESMKIDSIMVNSFSSAFMLLRFQTSF